MELSVSVKLEEESIIFHAGQQMTCIVSLCTIISIAFGLSYFCDDFFSVL